MSSLILAWTIHGLGFVGLAAVGLLPLRVFHELRNGFKKGFCRARNKPLAGIMILASVGSLSSDVWIVMLVRECLVGNYCGPNLASGWAYLAIMGVVYLIYEAMFLALRRPVWGNG